MTKIPTPIKAQPVVQSRIIQEPGPFTPDYDWDYIYDLMCDPRLNPFDQIKYSEQISHLKREMEDVYKDRLQDIIDLKKTSK